MARHHRSRPTAREVAELAGVSVATVSLVMNGQNHRVGEQTRQRVLAAADELAYVQSSSARSLRLSRTERVCLVVGSIGVPAYDQLARDLHAAAEDAGYGVITIVVDSPDRARKAADLLQQRVADGAVVAASVPHMSGLPLQGVIRSRLPLVIMSNDIQPDGFDVVRSTEAAVCAEALDHLFSLGRQRIAFVGHHHEVAHHEVADQKVAHHEGTGGSEVVRPSQRLAAYLDALARHGIPQDQAIVVPGADDRVVSYRAVGELMRRKKPPDAIFAASDRAAISAIWALRDGGHRVPGDVAVVGVGNLAEGLITRPALTTVGPPGQDYGAVARLLFDRILAKEPLPGREITNAWSFIRRESA